MKHGTPISSLRLVGKVEAISFLALLFVGMPLKYLGDLAVAVKITGWIHGVLFLVFCLALARAKRAAGLSNRLAAMAFVAALLPFGPFVMDRRLGDVQVAMTRTER